MKSKLWFILTLVALLIIGCASQVKASKKLQVYVSSHEGLYVICDPHKGVEYITFETSYNGPLTPRYNQDRTLSKCDKE